MKIIKLWAGTLKGLTGYWGRYGGWKALVTSPFFFLAAFLTFICTPFWWGGEWWKLSSSIIPSILGFSIAAFAMLMSIGDDKFKLKFGQIRGGAEISTLGIVATAFFHAILVQIVALFFSLVGGARVFSFLIEKYPSLIEVDSAHLALLIAAKAFRALGFFLIAYALASALAAAMTIYRLALIYSKHATFVLSSTEKGGADGGGSPNCG